MIIKSPKLSPRWLEKLQARLGKAPQYFKPTLQILLIALILGSLFFGFQIVRDSFTEKRFQAQLTKLRAGQERITLDIKFKHVQKLAHKRDIAMKQGFLLTSTEDYVPATIRYKNRSIRAKVRLKGDTVEHIDRHWSFRVKLRGEENIFGMKNFSLQHPRTRNYIHEWLFFKALSKLDVIALRYRFVYLTVNGEDKGLYALEEHFEKRLLENNQRREGPIVKYNESLWWHERQAFPYFEAKVEGRTSRSPAGYSHYYTLPADGFEEGKLMRSPAQFEQYKTAVNLLEQFRRHDITASEAFDVERMGVNFSLGDVFGSQHLLSATQFRFYYNPMTSLLELISFDFNGGNHLTGIGSMYQIEIDDQHMRGVAALPIEHMFKDLKLYESYIQGLNRFSQRPYLDSFFADVRPELNELLTLMSFEFPNFQFSSQPYYDNQDYIRTLLNPGKAMHAYYKTAKDRHLELELGSIQVFPVKVTALILADGTRIPTTEKVILPGKLRRLRPVDFRMASFKLPTGHPWPPKDPRQMRSMRVEHHILGLADQKRVAAVFPWAVADDAPMGIQYFKYRSELAQFPFLKLDENKKQIEIKPGSWDINQPVIFPKGYSVKAGPGTRLNLINRAFILSYSPLHWTGTAEQPMIVESKDRSGSGLIVINANKKSKLEHVTLRSLAPPRKDGWQLTGAVTFYQSDLQMRHCLLESNFAGDDLLNVMRGNIHIADSLFRNAYADSIDLDFAKGKIVRSHITDAKNDGVDLSGSTVDLRQLSMTRIGDKGVSVGENSNASGTMLELTNVAVGLAAKDLSTFVGSNIEINGAEVGLAAFRKKSSFAGATMKLSQVTMRSVKTKHLLEKGSQITLDGKKLETNHRDIEQSLYADELLY